MTLKPNEIQNKPKKPILPTPATNIKQAAKQATPIKKNNVPYIIEPTL